MPAATFSPTPAAPLPPFTLGCAHATAWGWLAPAWASSWWDLRVDACSSWQGMGRRRSPTGLVGVRDGRHPERGPPPPKGKPRAGTNAEQRAAKFLPFLLLPKGRLYCGCNEVVWVRCIGPRIGTFGVSFAASYVFLHSAVCHSISFVSPWVILAMPSAEISKPHRRRAGGWVCGE